MEFPRKYGVASKVYFPMVKAGSRDFAASGDWTPATGDVKISLDGAAASNTTNLPTAVSGMNKWELSLTAAEHQAKNISINIVDSATKAVEDQAIEISTYGDSSAQHPDSVTDVLDEDMTTHSVSGSLAERAKRLPNINAGGNGGLPTVDGSNKIVGLQPGINFVKNTALNNFTFGMVDSVDHVAYKTSLAVTAQRSIDGGAFAACANSVSEITNGAYKINLAASDLNGDVVTFLFTAAGADPLMFTVLTQTA